MCLERDNHDSVRKVTPPGVRRGKKRQGGEKGGPERPVHFAKMEVHTGARKLGFDTILVKQPHSRVGKALNSTHIGLFV